MLFATSKKLNLIDRLISAGANVNRRDSSGITPLGQAVINYSNRKNNNEKDDDVEVIQKLMHSGAKAETLNNKGYWSPLMRAADLDCYDAAVRLIACGAKEEFADVDGDTAFVYAKKKKSSAKLASYLDPGSKLQVKNIIFKSVRIVIRIIAIMWVFFSMDALSRVISSFNFSPPVLIGASIFMAHLLTMYIGIIIWGVKGYFENLRGTFNFVSSILFYIFLIPIIFPLVVAVLHFLTRFLPDGLNAALSFPVEMLTASDSNVVMLIMYILFLAIWIGGLIGLSIFTKKFDRIMDNYKYYK